MAAVQDERRFEFAEIALDTVMTKAQVDATINLLHRCIKKGKGSFTLSNHDEMRKTLKVAADRLPKIFWLLQCHFACSDHTPPVWKEDHLTKIQRRTTHVWCVGPPNLGLDWKYVAGPTTNPSLWMGCMPDVKIWWKIIIVGPVLWWAMDCNTILGYTSMHHPLEPSFLTWFKFQSTVKPPWWGQANCSSYLCRQVKIILIWHTEGIPCYCPVCKPSSWIAKWEWYWRRASCWLAPNCMFTLVKSLVLAWTVPLSGWRGGRWIWKGWLCGLQACGLAWGILWGAGNNLWALQDWPACWVWGWGKSSCLSCNSHPFSRFWRTVWCICTFLFCAKLYILGVTWPSPEVQKPTSHVQCALYQMQSYTRALCMRGAHQRVCRMFTW